MKSCCLLISLMLCLFTTTVMGQVQRSSYRFRLGATVSSALSNIGGNKVGLGGLAGAEKRIDKTFTVEAEASYTYFTGDKALYEDGKNKAYTIPVMAGIKAYFSPNLYASLRTGAVYFLLNKMNAAQIRLAYGLAAGMNLPQKNNRVNVQLGYTGFQNDGKHCGYATLGAAIIIN